MKGTGRGSEHRGYCANPPPPHPPLQIWKQTGTRLWGEGWGAGCLCLCICYICKHKCRKMLNSSTYVCFCYSRYTGLTEISYSTNKRWEIWLRGWEAKFIAFPNPEVRSEDTDKRDGDCGRICLYLCRSLLLRTTIRAGRKVVLVVLIFDISSRFHRLCCGKAVMHMDAHICTHRKDTTTCTFLLQKHTDNLYLCVHSVGSPLTPHKYTNSMQTHLERNAYEHMCMPVCLYHQSFLNHRHRIIHTRLHNSTTRIHRIFKFIHHTPAVTKWSFLPRSLHICLWMSHHSNERGG